MLARTIASYTEKNTNSKISVQGAMLVSTNGTTTLSKIPTIIRGKDGRGKTPLLQIKTIQGLKREKFLPLWCDTYLWSTAWSVCSQTQKMLSCYFGMWIIRHIERFETLRMVDNENNLILLIRRTSLMIQEISGLDLAQMEWAHSERWGTHTVCG